MPAEPTLSMTLDYLELPAPDIAAAKAFYGAAFGWTFTDYGSDYAAFHGATLEGGLDRRGAVPPRGDADLQAPNGSLAIFRTDDLVAAEAHIEKAGGRITTPAFDFPGGRRFHFADPNGVELAVWCLAEEGAQ